MNDVATFFRDREKDQGQTYQFDVESPKGMHRFRVYAQRPFEFRPQNRSDGLKELRSAVSTQGGGGVIVKAEDEAGSRILSVTRVASKSYQPPEHCTALSPGRPPTPFQMDGVGYKFPGGSHLVVPVDDESKQCLETFVGYLSFLSPDIESIVLNAIRRPSLDTRLNRVENRLFDKTADEELAASDNHGFGRLVRLLNPMVAFLIAMLFFVVLAGVSGFLLYRIDSGVKNLMKAAAEAARNHPAVEPLKTGGPPLRKVEPAVTQAGLLFKRLQKKGDSDELFKTLYDVHFASLGSNPTDEEIGKVLKEPATGQMGDQARHVQWGLIKLQMLQLLGRPLKDDEFLKAWDNFAITMKLYNKIPKPAIEGNPAARRFLSAIACLLKNPNTVPLQGDCAKGNMGDLEKGLQALTGFVEKER
jgi:hypothetical protein